MASNCRCPWLRLLLIGLHHPARHWRRRARSLSRVLQDAATHGDYRPSLQADYYGLGRDGEFEQLGTVLFVWVVPLGYNWSRDTGRW
jgi:hypothetical protein